MRIAAETVGGTPRAACRRDGTTTRVLTLGALAGWGLAAAAVAQQATLTLEQIERKYRRMSVVHIEKCDYDRDGRFTKTEQLCVAGIYQAMYLDND